jgi:hypothetical protein
MVGFSWESVPRRVRAKPWKARAALMGLMTAVGIGVAAGRAQQSELTVGNLAR